MTARGIAVDVLLALAVAIVLASSVGLLVMRDVYQKAHYLTPAGLVAPVVVGVAVLVQSGLTLDTAETGLALLFVLISSPILTHATIRAARDPGDGRLASAAGCRPPPSRARNGHEANSHERGACRRRGDALHGPAGLMDALQVTLLVLVAAGATAVVLIRVPVRQVIALSAYGLLLAILFLAFQAPDVTLSELTVGTVILPILLLLALAKVGRREK